MTSASTESSPRLIRRIRDLLPEVGLLLLFAWCCYLLLSLVSYDPADPSPWQASSATVVPANIGGRFGAHLAASLLRYFGGLSYFWPPLILYLGWRVLLSPRRWSGMVVVWIGHSIVGIAIAFAAACTLLALYRADAQPRSGSLADIAYGGQWGQDISAIIVPLFNPVGSALLMVSILLASLALLTGLSWLQLLRVLLLGMLHGLGWCQQQGQRWRRWWGNKRAANAMRDERIRRVEAQPRERKRPTIIPAAGQIKSGLRAEKERQIPLFSALPAAPQGQAGLPELSLLDAASEEQHCHSDESLAALSRLLEIKLADFGIEVKVDAVHPGPVITRFELLPAAGVKVSQISNLAKDLARSLSVASLRVVEVIPGKPTVGLEVPNAKRLMVRLGEILGAEQYERLDSPLALGLGKDIGGYPVVVDLARMPHLLVAGTTGAGKSVAVNAMLLSLLYKSRADQVRLILIDPKMLELSVYQDIPHLLTPVVTDMKDAAKALNWSVQEMERRYQLMAALGVRNLAGFNRRIATAQEQGKPLLDPLAQQKASATASGLSEEAENSATVPLLEPLPYIVVVIDELADLMLVTGKKVEELIARIAQKARAAGIHLILATQRPSVDVITGLIKANIPTRIAFQVSSKVDSRTILDANGAEQLLGHGDMLYLPLGEAHPTRVHGAFVADHEVHRVVKRLKEQARANYVEEVVRGPEMGAEDISSEGSDDALYDQAVAIVTESRRASISHVQRRLKIGYNRAARMIEQMEAAGVVSAMGNNGSREVFAPPPPPPR